MILNASYVYLLHSSFVENHLIWILEDGWLISEVVVSHKLGLPSYPGVPSPPANGRPVVGGVELACSQVATMCQLVWEALAIVGWDILHPERVSLKEKGEFYLCFSDAFKVP
jgi:hypothetical protein